MRRSPLRWNDHGPLRLRPVHHRRRLGRRARQSHVAGPGRASGRRRRSAISAAPASTWAAFRRSSSSTRRTTARTSKTRRASAGRVGSASFDWPTLHRENKDTEIARLNGVYARLLDDAGVTRIEGRARGRRPAHRRGGGRRYHRREPSWSPRGAGRRCPTMPGHRARHHLERGLPPRAAAARLVIVSAAATSPSSSPGSFTAWAPRSCSSTAGRSSCGASTTTCARRSRRRCGRRGSTCASTPTWRGSRSGRGPSSRPSRTAASSSRRDLILYATGRAPLTRGLGPRGGGRRARRRRAPSSSTSSRAPRWPSIWAIGDVTDRINLTPVAIARGHGAGARRSSVGEPTRPDHEDVPSAVFSQPPIGSVGLTEAAGAGALRRGRRLPQPLPPLKHTLSGPRRARP